MEIPAGRNEKGSKVGRNPAGSRPEADSALSHILGTAMEPAPFPFMETLASPRASPADGHVSGNDLTQTAGRRHGNPRRMLRISGICRKHLPWPCSEPVLLAYGRAGTDPLPEFKTDGMYPDAGSWDCRFRHFVLIFNPYRRWKSWGGPSLLDLYAGSLPVVGHPVPAHAGTP